MRVFPIVAVLGGIAWSVYAAKSHHRGAAPAVRAETVASSASPGDAFSWKGRLAAGQELAVRGVNGDIRAMRADGPEAEVSARKRGRRSDPDEVQIAVVPYDAGVTICAVYPSPRHSRPNECLPGGEGRSNTSNNDVEVDFTVHVPAGVRLVAKTVQGDVNAESLAGPVDASSVNGDVDFSTTSYGWGHTVNGSLSAAVGSGQWPRALEFSSVNGSVTLTLPSQVDAAIEAGTVNGAIESDFPLTMSGRFSARRFSGTIGNGGQDLRLHSVNGSIRLRRAP